MKELKKQSIESLSDDELLEVFQRGIIAEINKKKNSGQWVALYDPVKRRVFREYPDGTIEYV